LVTGPTTLQIAGKQVEKSLSSYGFEVDRLIITQPGVEEIDEARNLIRGQEVKFTIGVGGGKNIDIAKISSSLENIPFISVPTVASHDGIASTNASIIGRKTPYSTEAQMPIAVIGDTKVIHNSPYRFLASGCGDLIANWTAIKDWQLGRDKRGEYYGDYAALLSKMGAVHIIENVSKIIQFTPESVNFVLEALISTGVAMGIAGSSRPASGSEHMFSHAIDRLMPNVALHGEQCGVGTIIMEYLHNGDWQKIRTTLKSIGAPTTAKQMGLPEDILVQALVKARSIRPERYSILSEHEINREKATQILTKTEII
ncbi:MAG: NAD(P)-dependent glycerol-1-phosphate dehydrogenase, partial [Candidatus Ranarchaeia archaeon]